MNTKMKGIALLLTLVLVLGTIGFNKVYADGSDGGGDANWAEPLEEEPEEPLVEEPEEPLEEEPEEPLVEEPEEPLEEEPEEPLLEEPEEPLPQKDSKDPTETPSAWRYSRPAASGGMVLRSNGPPASSQVVNPDQVAENQLQPGQVRMTKTAALVPGKVNEWEITLRVAGRPKSVTSDIVLVMDVSGSMAYDIPGMPYDRMHYAKEAADNFIDAVLNKDPDNTQIAIVKFNNTVSTVQTLTNSKSLLHSGIEGLSASSYTHTQAGIARARSILSSSGATKKTIVLFSDGLPNRSYAINSPTVADFYPDTRLSRSDLARTRFNYSSTVTDGNQALNDGGTRYNYSSPNSTIAEGAIARGEGYTLYTIGMYAGAEGQATLNATAPGKAYASDAAGLNAVFQEIAGLLGSPVATAVVTDPMASGFVLTGAISKTGGNASYDDDTDTLTWNFPSLTQDGTGDIKFEELSYRIKITEDTPYTSGLLPTNGPTPMSFTDSDGVDSVNYFQIPEVDPVFVTLDKVLLDAQGNPASSTKKFTISIDGQPYSISADDPVKVIKKVWNVGSYPVTEAAEDPPYIVAYAVNGSPGNQINLAQDGPDQEIVVTNRENVAQVTIAGTKTLTGRTGGVPADKFKFELSSEAGDKLPTLVMDELTFNGNDVKSFSFGEITYTMADLGDASSKDFVYQVKEIKPSPAIPGMIYDSNLTRQVTVTLSKDAEGILIAAVNPASVDFANRYSAKSVSAAIVGTKTLTGRTGTSPADLFKFKLSSVAGDKLPTRITDELTFNGNGMKPFSFGEITYIFDDLEGAPSRIFTYQVEEIDEGIPGMTYGTPLVRTVKVTVTDEGDGNLSVSVNPTSVDFANRYAAKSVSAAIVGTKTLTGRTGTSPADVFKFKLSSAAGDRLPSLVTDELTFNGNGVQPFGFGEVTYTFEDLEGAISKIFTYQVEEVDEGIPGMDYGTPLVRTVNVRVTDEGDGNLSVSVNPASVDFINNYSPEPVTAVISGSKQLTGRTGNFTDVFKFSLSAAAGTPLPDPATVSVTFTDNGTKPFSFPAIPYTLGDLGGASSKIFTYQVEEIDEGIPGMSYGSPRVRTVQVTVSDLGDGTLSAELDTAADLAYVNTYTASGSYRPLASKELIGGDLAAGDFEFELLDSSYKLLQKVRNEADGAIPFEPLTFDLDDAGKTRIFIIRELEGEEENLIYDTDERLLTLHIRDTGNGELEVLRDPDEEALVFTNLYELVAGDVDAPVTGEGRTTYFYLGILMIPLALAALTLGLSRRRRKGLTG